jgi:hypothetical protein|tara:strand:+ start:233 stop:412 length:180 start_codon:yes stop_codon:yes gene_type:complete
MRIEQEYRDCYPNNGFGNDWENGIEKEVFVMYDDQGRELGVFDTEQEAFEEHKERWQGI